MQADTLRELVAILSRDRIEAYSHPGEPAEDAIIRYAFNVMVCESLYPSLHLLEVGLRNAIDKAFTRKFGSGWIRGGTGLRLNHYQLEGLDRTRRRLSGRDFEPTRARVIADTSFSFWTRLLGREYEHAWHGVLKAAFPGLRGKGRTRRVLADRFDRVRRFRNKVFHHDYVLGLPIRQRHDDVLEAVGWIDPTLERLARELDSFPEVWRSGMRGARRLVGDIDDPKPETVRHW